MEADWFPIPKDNLTYKNISTVISVLFASIIKFLSLYISEFRGIVICDQEHKNLDCLPIDYTIKNMEKIKKYSNQINVIDSRRILAMINIAELLIEFLDKFTKVDRYRDYVITDMFEKKRLHKLVLKAEELIQLNSESMKYKYAIYKINDLPNKSDDKDIIISEINIDNDLLKAIGKEEKTKEEKTKEEKPKEEKTKEEFGRTRRKKSKKKNA